MNNTFAYYVTNYFKEYLPKIRNYSNNTRISYKDTIIQLINYLEKNGIDHSDINNISYQVINNFLLYLEQERNLSLSSINQRLACIHSLFKYIKKRELSYFDECSQILSIEYKKTPKPIVSYMIIDELKILLSIPNTKNNNQFRHLVLLTLLYETGAIVSTVINIKLKDININERYVILHGKGNKTITVPISKDVLNLINSYIERFNIVNGEKYIFSSKYNEKMSRFGVLHIINTYVKKAKEKHPHYFIKKITPHTFRHSKAMHLLEAGVNLVYIRDILGHESVTTTEIYARTNPEIKRKAIEKNSKSIHVKTKYNDVEKDDLLNWLKNYVK